MVHHNIEHFDDYLLAKLEQLEREQSPASAGHTLPHVDTANQSVGTRSAPTRTRQRRPRPLPNLLENTLVARFRRVALAPGQVVDGKSGRLTQNHCLSTGGGGYVNDRGETRSIRDAWCDALTVTDDGLSLLRGRPGSRGRKDRKAVSAPCERSGADEEMTPEQRQRAADAARVLMAVDTVKQSRKKWIMDRTIGVPRQFEFEKPHFKLVYDKSGQYRRKPSNATMTTAVSCDDVPSNVATARSLDEEKEGKTKKPLIDIPGNYVFPREGSFIPRETCFVHEAGVDWNLNPTRVKPSPALPTPAGTATASTGVQTPSYQQNQTPLSPGRTQLTDIRRRCRVSYPVTEALHREGTSITKLKAKTLRPGEMKVSKVWQGTADPCIPPSHLARSLRVELPSPRDERVAIPSPYKIPFVAGSSMGSAQLAN